MMAKISQIKGVDKVIQKLQQELQKKLDSPKAVRGRSVIVGYTAAYALDVHENIKMKWKGIPRKEKIKGGKGKFWDPQGKAQAKFLEAPARKNAKQIGNVIRTAVQNGVSLEKAMVLGALLLQRESQKLVPVDTGNLKGSAFTKFEK